MKNMGCILDFIALSGLKIGLVLAIWLTVMAVLALSSVARAVWVWRNRLRERR